MQSNIHLIVSIYTGNRKNAGTDSTVYIKIYCDDGTASKPMELNSLFSNNFERESIDTFRFKEVENLDRFVKIDRLELWKEKTLGILSDDWYVDKIVVENRATNETFNFPVFRWIQSDRHYHVKHLDTSLPQFDEFPHQRKMELEDKKKVYQFEQKVINGLAQVKSLPPDEEFSFDYQWNTFLKPTMQNRLINRLNKLTQKKWTRLDDVQELYSGNHFEKPIGADSWNSDIEFGRQRVASVNPCLIFLMKSIPEKFPVTDELLGPLLEGMTIHEAIEERRLFLCDFKILDGISQRPGFVLCKPIGLFFVDNKRQLRPVAIQLFQKPGHDNPIFTPLDDPMLWTYVKMWYNNTDSNIQQALTHLGLTHLIMEGITIAVHRNLSPSHPVFKIMAPHFLYLIAINSKALEILINEGGWVSKITNIGSTGLHELVAKRVDEWRLDVEGLVSEDLKARGLDDPSVLPGYYYRDDAILLFQAIKKYVTSYVHIYYTSQEMVKDDKEIQAWARELVKERNGSGGGVGLKGVPGNGSINSQEDLVKIITSVIYTCSVSHASANFGQYDEYAFPPKYPMLFRGKPPSSKDLKITEKTWMDSCPDAIISRNILSVTKVLSRKGTLSLGDFEVQYIFDPKATKVLSEFREDLKAVSKKIKNRNKRLERPYEYLLPENIPNSISI